MSEVEGGKREEREERVVYLIMSLNNSEFGFSRSLEGGVGTNLRDNRRGRRRGCRRA